MSSTNLNLKGQNSHKPKSLIDRLSVISKAMWVISATAFAFLLVIGYWAFIVSDDIKSNILAKLSDVVLLPLGVMAILLFASCLYLLSHLNAFKQSLKASIVDTEKIIALSHGLQQVNNQLTEAIDSQNENFRQVVKDCDRLKELNNELDEKAENIKGLLTQTYHRTSTRYQSLFNSYPQPMVVYNLKTQEVLDANIAAEKAYSLNPDEVIGLPIFALLPDDEKPKFKAKLKDVIANGNQIHSFDYAYQTEDTELAIINFSSHPVSDLDNQTHLVVITDLTQKLQAEEKFQHLAESVTDIFFETNSNLLVTFWNSGAAKASMISAKEAISVHISALLPKIAQPVTLDVFKSALINQKAQSLTLKATDINNLEIHYQLYVYPSRIGISVIAKDITQQRKNQQQLLDRELRFRAIFNNTLQSTALLTNDGRVVDINSTFLDLIGLTTNQAIGRYYWDLSLWQHSQQVVADVAEAVKVANETKTQVRFQTTYQDKDHMLRYFDFILKPIFSDQSDTPTQLVAECHDVSESIAALQQVKHSEALYRMLAQNLPNGTITLIDRQSHVKFIEGRELSLLDFENTRYIGTNLITDWYADMPNLEDIKIAIETAFDGNNATFEVSNYNKIYKSECVPITDAANKVYMVMILSLNITERRLSELALMEAKVKAENANLAKTNFLANMSHELRNPINALLGVTQLLDKYFGDNPKISQYTAIMNHSSQRLLKTIGEVLDVSRIEANKITLNASIVNINALVEKVYNAHWGLAQTKGLSFTIQIAELPVISAFVDDNLVYQILSNLVGNAIKFTPKGNVIIGLKKVKIASTEHIQISVKDTGPGMSDSYMETKLFKAFEQESEGYARNYEGSGLGLYISKRLATLMNGNLYATSTINEGSTFNLEFKLG